MLTDKQLQDRKNYIGGSEVAAILGMSPYVSTHALYRQKLGETPSFEGNKHTRAGSIMEPSILAFYNSETDVKLQPLSDDELERIHPVYPYMRGHLDGIDIKGGVIECKNVGSFAAKEWGCPDKLNVPDSHLVQLMYYCAITDAPYGKIVAYFGGSDMRVYHYERQATLEKEVIERVKNFWENHILTKVPPSPSTLQDVLSYWPTKVGKIKVAQDQLHDNLYSLKKVRDQKKELCDQEEKLLVAIWKDVEDADTITDPVNDVIACAKNIETLRFNVDDFKKDHDGLYKKYLKSSAHKTLRIKL